MNINLAIIVAIEFYLAPGKKSLKLLSKLRSHQ